MKKHPVPVAIFPEISYNKSSFLDLSKRKGLVPMDSVILGQPLVPALVMYGLALALVLFDRTHKATKGVFTLISTALVALATTYSLVRGASMWECATVLLVFLLLNMGVKD